MKIGPTERGRRVMAANRVLDVFAPSTEIYWVPRKGFCVEWDGPGGVRVRRRYITGIPWHSKWGHGGTACAALSALVRWCQGDPDTISLSWWRRITESGVALVTAREVEILRRAGYPG